MKQIDKKEYLLTENELAILGLRSKSIMSDFYPDKRSVETLEEVGKKFGVTRERIRQVEAKAREKIRQIIRELEKQSNESPSK